MADNCSTTSRGNSDDNREKSNQTVSLSHWETAGNASGSQWRSSQNLRLGPSTSSDLSRCQHSRIQHEDSSFGNFVRTMQCVDHNDEENLAFGRVDVQAASQPFGEAEHQYLDWMARDQSATSEMRITQHPALLASSVEDTFRLSSLEMLASSSERPHSQPRSASNPAAAQPFSIDLARPALPQNNDQWDAKASGSMFGTSGGGQVAFSGVPISQSHPPQIGGNPNLVLQDMMRRVGHHADTNQFVDFEQPSMDAGSDLPAKRRRSSPAGILGTWSLQGDHSKYTRSARGSSISAHEALHKTLNLHSSSSPIDESCSDNARTSTLADHLLNHTLGIVHLQGIMNHGEIAPIESQRAATTQVPTSLKNLVIKPRRKPGRLSQQLAQHGGGYDSQALPPSLVVGADETNLITTATSRLQSVMSESEKTRRALQAWGGTSPCKSQESSLSITMAIDQQTLRSQEDTLHIAASSNTPLEDETTRDERPRRHSTGSCNPHRAP